MNDFKVGDKVLFDGEIKTISKVGLGLDVNGLDNNYVMFKGINDDVFKIDDLDPYKSAHDKLIELGWELKFKNENGFIYEKEHLILYILKKELSYSIAEYFEEDYNDDFVINTIVNLELSKVLTQFLEELS